MAPSHYHLNLKRYKLYKGVVVAFKDNPEDAHEADTEKLDGRLPCSDPWKIQAIGDQSGQSFQAEKRCSLKTDCARIKACPAENKISYCNSVKEY